MSILFIAINICQFLILLSGADHHVYEKAGNVTVYSFFLNTSHAFENNGNDFFISQIKFFSSENNKMFIN